VYEAVLKMSSGTFGIEFAKVGSTTKLNLRRPTEGSSKEALWPLAGFCSLYCSCSPHC
jgi:hypothetical protein